MEAIALLLAKYPIAGTVLAVLGSLVLIVQVIVAVTPSKKDDELLAKAMNDSVFGKIISFLVSFAPIQKSSKGFELSNTSLGK